jgi:hypothetical protein
MVLGVSILTTLPIAYAQYGVSKSPPTPEQLAECKRLGIEPDQCSDSTILAKQRIFIGPNPPSPTFDGLVFATMIGSGVALVIGIFAVRKIRKVRKSDDRI